MTGRRLRVVKVGGSLLERPGLSAALRSWLQSEPPAATVLLAGGGEWAEAIRRADRAHGLGDERSHWLCIDAMRVTGRVLAAVLDDLPLVENFAELQRWLAATRAPGAFVLDAYAFLHAVEPQLTPPHLPHDWSATSDSIAARIAAALGADELVILKSAPPPAGATLEELSARGYIDAYLPVAAQYAPAIRFVALVA